MSTSEDVRRLPFAAATILSSDRAHKRVAIVIAGHASDSIKAVFESTHLLVRRLAALVDMAPLSRALAALHWRHWRRQIVRRDAARRRVVLVGLIAVGREIFIDRLLQNLHLSASSCFLDSLNSAAVERIAFETSKS